MSNNNYRDQYFALTFQIRALRRAGEYGQAQRLEKRQHKLQFAHNKSQQLLEPASSFRVTRKTGRCLEGERDGGSVLHWVGSFSISLCGTEPGRRAGWSDHHYAGPATCPRCVAKMAKLAVAVAT
jgi:hypothetical protein